MRAKPTKRLFNIVLVYHNNMTRMVKVKAASREVAERRALKLNPSALGVQQPK